MKKWLKQAVLAVGLVAASSAFAGTTNNVYIDQIGDASTIAITQHGSGNEAGNDTTATTLHGNAQNITINQIGTQNTHNVNIQGGNATLTSTVTGDNNTTTVNCGAAPSTTCTDTSITANATGNGNTMNITAGAKSTMSVVVNGNTNNTQLSSVSSNIMGAKADIKETGDSNNVNVSQNGPAGANGFTTTVDITGGSNTIGVTQSGTIDSNVNIKSVGSNNNITVTSGN